MQSELVPVLTSEVFGRRRMVVPATALKPVLRKQSELKGIQIAPETLRGRLLDLRRFVLPENEPKNGSAPQDKWLVMPEALAEYVRRAGRTYLVRGETRVLIPCLSAVKPNGLGPGKASTFPSLLEVDVPRMWYMVPDLAPRHLPSLCVPRIIHDEPNAILNADPPVLIDANFSTLWCEGDTWTAESVFAILNSTWGELCMEALGATLGGGALKLEATHLRQLPIPAFSGSEKESLRSLVREALDLERTMSELRHHRTKIDRVVLSALAQRKVSVTEVKAIVEKLGGIIHSLRAKRRRHHNYEPTDKG